MAESVITSDILYQLAIAHPCHLLLTPAEGSSLGDDGVANLAADMIADATPSSFQTIPLATKVSGSLLARKMSHCC